MMYRGTALDDGSSGRLTAKQARRLSGVDLAGWIGFAFVVFLAMACGFGLGNFWMGG